MTHYYSLRTILRAPPAVPLAELQPITVQQDYCEEKWISLNFSFNTSWLIIIMIYHIILYYIIMFHFMPNPLKIFLIKFYQI